MNCLPGALWKKVFNLPAAPSMSAILPSVAVTE